MQFVRIVSSIVTSYQMAGRIKLCQYADDTSVIVTTDLALNALFHLFTRYEKASGVKLNVTKCHGLLIGTWQSRFNLPIALYWSNVEIIIPGSRISNDSEEQWESKIKALKTSLVPGSLSIRCFDIFK